MGKTRLLNVPNVLTSARILMIPAFVLTYFKLPEDRWIAFSVYVAASLTDAVDGYIARKYDQITWFGKLFDPLADKLMALAMLFSLAFDGVIAWWLLGIMLAKELYMIAGASLLLHKDFVVKADSIGKIATALFVLSACLVMPWHGNQMVGYIGNVLMLISAGFSIASAVNYTVLAFKSAYEKRERS